MIVKAKKFNMIYSAIWDDWELETDEFIIRVKYLLVHGIDGVKVEWQRLRGINGKFNLIKKDNNGMAILLSWDELEKEKLYSVGDPDKPRSLAKTVTVK